jgi:precorrin-3B synthase
MERADGWLMRIRLPGGIVSSEQLALIAEVGSSHGSGIIEITSRANVQIRGVVADHLDQAAAQIIDAALAHADPGLDARRAVVSSPLSGFDPTEAGDVRPFVAAVLEALRRAEFVGALPPKFGIVIDGGGVASVRNVPGDMVFTAERAVDRRVRWRLTVGSHSYRVRAELSPQMMATAVVECARRFAEASSRWHDLPTPARALLDAVRSEVKAANPGSGSAVGQFDHVDRSLCNVVAAPALGRIGATELLAVARSARLADGVRCTSSGGFAFIGVRRDRAVELLRELELVGVSGDPSDPVHSVSACVGAPGCTSSRANTVAAAVRMVEARRQVAEPQHRIHLSGCEKLCGAPIWAQTLVADAAGEFIHDERGNGIHQ